MKCNEVESGNKSDNYWSDKNSNRIGKTKEEEKGIEKLMITEGERTDSETGTEIENDSAHGCAFAAASRSLQHSREREVGGYFRVSGFKVILIPLLSVMKPLQSKVVN